jgi:hypothetical protein
MKKVSFGELYEVYEINETIVNQVARMSKSMTKIFRRWPYEDKGIYPEVVLVLYKNMLKQMEQLHKLDPAEKAILKEKIVTFATCLEFINIGLFIHRAVESNASLTLNHRIRYRNYTKENQVLWTICHV